MDFRFLIVGAPFLIAFFYTLFWLNKWGAFNSTNNNLPKNISLKNKSINHLMMLLMIRDNVIRCFFLNIS